MPNTAGETPVVIACGALVRELRATLPGGFEATYLPAQLHNRPERIAEAVEAALRTIPSDRRVLVGYGDCGTGGELDRVLLRYPNAVRLPGDHCYQFIAGTERFEFLANQELGTLYLTDFLTRNFEQLIWTAYRLDTNPELIPMMFGQYRRVVRLAQTDSDELDQLGQQAAAKLGLDYVVEPAGPGPFSRAVEVALATRPTDPEVALATRPTDPEVALATRPTNQEVALATRPTNQEVA